MNFYDICILIDFISAIIIFFVFFLSKWNNSVYELFVKGCFYIYVVAVLYFTCIIPIFIPIPFVNLSISQLHINLVPFVDYIYSRGDYIMQIFLNILMFIPFGIMYPFIYKKNFKNTMIAGIILSLSIEIIQLFSVRQISSCDITDLVNNVLGIIIGYMICKIFEKPVKKLLNKFFSNKQLKTFTVQKRIQKIVVGIIILQLFIRSIMIMFI